MLGPGIALSIRREDNIRDNAMSMLNCLMSHGNSKKWPMSYHSFSPHIDMLVAFKK